ncbi:MAG: hypothetical protein IT301_06675 [Dehalococcoidia bacterium]|nr:hypothetical protein [Dehalococcoidia bacterium]
MTGSVWRARLTRIVEEGLLPGLAEPDALNRFADCIEQSLADHAAIRAGKNLPKATRGPGPEFAPFAEVKELAAKDWREAVWLAGIATLIGWDRPESIGQLYNGMYRNDAWTWARVSADGGKAMAEWIGANAELLHKVAPFGSHRAYQSHRPGSPTSTGRVVRSLVAWLKANPHELHPETSDFDRLFHALEPVSGFGRTARFDLARLLGLLGLAPLEPKQCFFQGSSGPQRGARLVFRLHDGLFARLEEEARGLGRVLGLSAQIVEDVCCQWQKGRRP